MRSDFRLLAADDAALEAVAVLMEEMQQHYHVPCPSRAEIISGLRQRPPGAEIMVVVQGDHVVAFCAFSAIYPGPGLQAGIFLKELYVAQHCRSGGLGKAMLRELAIIARQRNLTRIDLTADAKDQRLLQFYDQVGGARKPEKLILPAGWRSALCIERKLAKNHITANCP